MSDVRENSLVPGPGGSRPVGGTRAGRCDRADVRGL